MGIGKMLKQNSIIEIKISDLNTENIATHLIDIDFTEFGREYFRQLTRDQRIVLKHQVRAEMENLFKNPKLNIGNM